MSVINRMWSAALVALSFGACVHAAPVGVTEEPADIDAEAVRRAMEAHGPIAGERLNFEMLDGIVEDWSAVEAREGEKVQAIENLKARNGRPGRWRVPPAGATRDAASGIRYVINEWGDTRMGIGFPGEVTIVGANILGQGSGAGVFAPGLRVHGYRNGELIETTQWFDQIGEAPEWFAMDLVGVDRIEIEARAAVRDAGWYGLDDLTYVPADSDRPVVVDFEDLGPREVLTGTGYSGLVWEQGVGPIDEDAWDGIPAPQPSPFDLIGEDAQGGDDSAPAIRDGGVRAASAPNLVQSFQGPERGDSNQFSFPPDTNGAVGPNHFVSVVNTIFQVHDKNGNLLASSSLGSFQPGTSGDPRVLYDNHSDRWIVMSTNFGTRIYLAVSETSNPLGSWFKGNFTAAAGADSGCWVDYPTLGYDEDGIYIAAFMVGCGYSMWAIEKAPLLDPSPSFGVITAFRQFEFDTVQPAQSYDTGSNRYTIALFNSSNVSVRRVTGPITAPALGSRQVVSVPQGNFPPDAPALGANDPLDTVGHRIMNAVFRNGRLYASQTISVSGRSAVRYLEINPSNFSLSDSAVVSDSSLYFYFPSVAVNDRGDLLLGFSGSNASQFPACYVAGRSTADPSGQISDPVLYRSGVASQDLIDNFGRNRYGDYSLTTVDPVDDETFWTIQEYNSSQNIWATWIGEFSFEEPDCNNNGVPDSQDILSGTSQDVNGNGTPDECEFAGSFQLLSPVDGATDIDPAAFNTFTWEEPDNADKYTITIATTPTFDPGSILVGPIDRSQPDLTVFSGTFQEATDYYWSVVAESDGNLTPSTPEVAMFSTIDPNSGCAGDINGDGVTDLGDFNVLGVNFGAGPGATLQQGDLSGNGFVDLADFNLLGIDFGCGL